MSSKLLQPPSIASMLASSSKDKKTRELNIEDEYEPTIVSEDSLFLKRSKSIGDFCFDNSDLLLSSDDDKEERLEEPSSIIMGKTGVGMIFDKSDSFQTFESLMKVEKMNSGSFHRVPFNIPGGKTNFFPVPWPVLSQKMKNLVTGKKNVFFKIDGFFFAWTPLVTHEKTTVSIGIIDKRGKSGKPKVINSVQFNSSDAVVSGMSLGTSIHLDNLKMVQFAVSLRDTIAGKNVMYASMDACFYISVSNQASHETHSVIVPVVIPQGVKNIMKSYKKTTEFLINANAKVIKKNEHDEDKEQVGSELNGVSVCVGPSTSVERVKQLTQQANKKTAVLFGSSRF